MEHYLNIPLQKKEILNLNTNDKVYLTGKIYTARDSAHKKLAYLLENNLPLPFDLQNACIYYAGPTPAKKGMAIGSIGPTTSTRMDKYTPILIEKGVKIFIGKGQRNSLVKKSLKDNIAIYLLAIGGLGALLSTKVISCKLIAFEELLSEAIYELEVKDFPVYVAYDTKGIDIYENNEK